MFKVCQLFFQAIMQMVVEFFFIVYCVNNVQYSTGFGASVSSLIKYGWHKFKEGFVNQFLSWIVPKYEYRNM